MIFDVGQQYRITAGLGDEEGYSTFTVIAFEGTLLKVEGAGIETIFNTVSPSFVKAERMKNGELLR